MLSAFYRSGGKILSRQGAFLALALTALTALTAQTAQTAQISQMVSASASHFDS